MSVNLEWSAPQRIVATYATVPLNQPIGLGSGKAWFYQVQMDGYGIVPAKFRPVSDSFSQADGSSIQPPYIDGLVASMEIGLWVLPRGVEADKEPACGEDLRLMDELLMGALDSLRAFPEDPATQEYVWTPTGAGDDRLLAGVMLGAWPEPDFAPGPPEVRLKVVLASPYPYAQGAGTATTTITDGTSETVTNSGNTDERVLMRAYGPSIAFAITDLDTGRVVSYDSSRPGGVAIGGGDYAQLDFFDGTIYLNGDPDQDLIAGLDPVSTDLFALRSGDQVIAASGADVQVDVRNAWV